MGSGLTESFDQLTRTTVYDLDEDYAVKAMYAPTIADLTKEHQSLHD